VNEGSAMSRIVISSAEMRVSTWKQMTFSTEFARASSVRQQIAAKKHIPKFRRVSLCNQGWLTGKVRREQEGRWRVVGLYAEIVCHIEKDANVTF
jgi:hypothetical protein